MLRWGLVKADLKLLKKCFLKNTTYIETTNKDIKI